MARLNTREAFEVALFTGVVSGFVRGLPPFVWRHKQEARATAMDPEEGFEDGEWDEEEEAQFRAAFIFSWRFSSMAARNWASSSSSHSPSSKPSAGSMATARASCP